MFEGRECKRNVTVHWFRHGLRFHDNPALLKAIKNSSEFYAIFIFDGDTAGKFVSIIIIYLEKVYFIVFILYVFIRY
jgi:deoxyribodipyrimidine photolyase